MPLISCQKSCFAYEGREVIHHLTFSVETGDYLCVVGENGSGKSTLMKGLLGLLSPSFGSIVLDNSLKRNEIGYLPQHCDTQNDFPATVSEVVRSGFPFSGPFLKKEQKLLMQKNMALLNIANLEKESFMNLSGGQQQRVLLSRALCCAKKLLLLDEPVAGLDPLISIEMYELIDHLNKNEHLTVIMISHDLSSALKYASHILHLSTDGYFFGTKDEYVSSDFSKLLLGGSNDVRHDE